MSDFRFNFFLLNFPKEYPFDHVFLNGIQLINSMDFISIVFPLG